MARTILVAEDGKVTREMVRLLLANHGYAVVECENGKDALEQVRRLRPDLVILDSEMPELSGFDVFRAMKQDPDCRDIPIIYLVADQAREYSSATLPPPEYLLSKPFGADALLRRVKGLLRESGGPPQGASDAGPAR